MIVIVEGRQGYQFTVNPCSLITVRLENLPDTSLTFHLLDDIVGFLKRKGSVFGK
jgi:hypothetical protein